MPAVANVEVISAVVFTDTERSVAVEHTLPVRLTFDSSNYDHGGFRSVPAKGATARMSADKFSSASSGFTGTEGHIFYRLNDRPRIIPASALSTVMFDGWGPKLQP